MKEIKQLLKNNKILTFTITSILFLALIIGVPTLAKLKNRTTLYDATDWDGTVASDFKRGDGTKENPFIISNGSEFAYFIKQLKETNYEDQYIELSNDIIINPGIFEYSVENSEKKVIKYLLNGETYYVKENTNEYYDNADCTGEKIGTLNHLSVSKDFKGNFNGKSFTVFGMYVFDSEKSEVSLFENLGGVFKDVYFSNSLVYGKGNISGLAINTQDSSISNLSYDGYVINKSETKEKIETLTPFSIVSNVELIEKIVELPSVELEGNIKSIKITGDYVLTDTTINTNLYLNGNLLSDNKFNVNLGTELLPSVSITTNSDIEGQVVNFSNIKYIIEYYDDIASGLFVNSTNSVLTNVINKATVNSEFLSSGFIANVNESLEVSNSYNNGEINSGKLASGLIGQIKNNTNHTTLINVYNAGSVNSNISSGIIGLIQNNTGLVNITNSINLYDNYAINTITETTVNIMKSYSINNLTSYDGLATGEFVYTDIQNFYNKEFMTKIGYNEFVSFNDLETNSKNIWIYEKNSMPILYIDDLNNPIATINVNKYSWNNFSEELNSISLKNNLTFSINQVDQINPIKEIYYFVDNQNFVLTKEYLDSITDWNPYTEPVKIEESGYYVIYAKIKDSNDDIFYINTDIIALNTTGFQANINFGDNSWDSLNVDPDEFYLSDDININISAIDALFGINSVEYYISNEILTEEQMKNITDWSPYTENILISTPGKYIVYAKIINGENVTKYINTDYLLYNGYTQTFSIGNKNIDYQTNYLTNNSSINFLFESNFELDFKEDYKHALILNTLLPEGTKLTLFDKVKNKIYSLKINSNEDLYGYNTSCSGISNCSKYATYKFSDFVEIGKTTSLNYDESQNYNNVLKNEKFYISIDFSQTNIIENYYDIFAYLAIKNDNDNFLYKTFDKSISKFNIYSLIEGKEIVTTHSLTSDYNNQPIYYNSNSETLINFYNLLEYQNINNKNIIDTTYENKKSGLLIGLYNENDELVNKKYLNNILFEVDNKEYFANSENIIKINLGNSTDIVKTLKIKTKENSGGLTNGQYYLKINKFISDDGYYYDSLLEDEIIVPIVVEQQQEIIQNYNFSVEMNAESVRINKNNDEHQSIFNVYYTGELLNPNIRVSLYEKKEYTAYNQDYKIVNLLNYTTDELSSAGSNQYFVDVGELILNIYPNNFNNNGYKFVFELYDGSRKISEVKKYFIVN